jgi:hypothetical protein
MGRRFKQLVTVLLVLSLALAVALFFVGKPKPVPPLPFEATNFVSTAPPVSLLAPPTNAPAWKRMGFYLLVTLPQKFRGTNASTWSFPASPRTGCSIHGLLDECAQVTGGRYLMPLGIAAGAVQFGNTNTLNGPRWVAAFENELQKGDVQYWDAPTKRMKQEHLVLLRFPEQKTILVLPESGVAEFERTNRIQIPP